MVIASNTIWGIIKILVRLELVKEWLNTAISIWFIALY